MSFTAWSPAFAPGGWKLIRYEQENAAGRPIGQPIVALTPTLRPRRFHSEHLADLAAQELNRIEGRA